MRQVLSPACLSILARFVREPLLLAFDFDGTLAPIVRDRERARMRRRTRGLLARACALYPCAILSGRSRADLLLRLEGVAPRFVIGNHGMEPGADTPAAAAAVARIERDLAGVLSGSAGVELENKRYSLAVHYRKAVPRERARVSIERAIQALPVRVRTIAGKSVVNVLPADAPDKADALLRLLVRSGVDRSLYVGDDVNDEPVFQLGPPERRWSVRVGRSPSSAATSFLRDQGEVDDLLAHLVRLREETPPSRSGRRTARPGGFAPGP